MACLLFMENYVVLSLWQKSLSSICIIDRLYKVPAPRMADNAIMGIWMETEDTAGNVVKVIRLIESEAIWENALTLTVRSTYVVFRA